MLQPFTKIRKCTKSRRTIQYRVDGFYSRSYIQINQFASFENVNRWDHTEITYSYGGYDGSESRADAIKNLGLALIDASEVLSQPHI